MTNGIEGLHEKLCAYVLGEADEATRIEVERELAASAELRAEKARIESTIGLVKNAMSGEEALSAQKAAAVLSAAQQPPLRLTRRPWYAHTSLRIAAGLSAVALGYLVFQATRETRTPTVVTSETWSERAKRELAASDAFTQKKAPSPLDEKLADAQLKDKGTYRGPSDQAPPSASKKLQGLGYNSNETDAKAIDRVAASKSKNQTTDAVVAALEASEGGVAQNYFDSGAAAPQPAEVGADALMKERRDSLDHEQEFSASSSIGVGVGGHAGSEVPSGFAGRRFGPGAKDHLDDATAPGTYVGAGDTVPPVGGTVVNSATSSSAPASSAPSGPTDMRTASLETKTRFRSLGYIGEESERDEAAQAGLVMRDPFSDESKRGLLYFNTPEERERYVDEECRRITRLCRRYPNERPRDMFFRFWGDNAFEFASLDAQSTFSVDVDTASYVLARRYINEGHVPTKAQVRTEEFVNYFKPDVAAPTEGTFRIHTDLAPSRFSNDQPRWMLRVVVRGREVSKQERKPLALTFVIDTSGSMKEQDRLETVKHSLRLLASQLDARDRIAVVRFSDDASVVLPMTSAAQRATIETAIEVMRPDGSTNSEAGLKLGYAQALDGLDPNAINRVVFLSDGVANRGETDPVKLSDTVKSIRERGVYLNTIGVGMNNHNDVFLEQLADKGDGVCNYVDTSAEAKKVLVDGFTGAFEPIARDVKVQVEFDPAQVYRYRLLGYENRAIADKDFRNDKIDAGEIGAGHQVTALYEIERTSAASEKPLATVRLRWKAPRVLGAPKPAVSVEGTEGDTSERATEIAQPVLASQATGFEGAGIGFRRAAIVAQFAEFLRRSVHARNDSFDELIVEAQKLEREANDAEFSDLVRLIVRSKDLVLASTPACDDLCQSIDILRRNEMLRAEYDSLKVDRDAKLLDDLERQNRDLEAKIRDLLRKKIEQR